MTWPALQQRPVRRPKAKVELLPEIAVQIRDLLRRDPGDLIALACADMLDCRITAAALEDAR